MTNDGDMILDGDDDDEDVGNRISSGNGIGQGNERGGEELVLRFLADLNEQLNHSGDNGSQEDQNQVGVEEGKNRLGGSQQEENSLTVGSQEIQLKEIETIKDQIKEKKQDRDRGKENSTTQTLISNRAQNTSETSTKNHFHQIIN